MKLSNGDTYEPFVEGHFRCCICGGDVSQDDLSGFNDDYSIHYDCEELYADDPDFDAEDFD